MSLSFPQLFKSKTFWAVVGVAGLNIFQAVYPTLPAFTPRELTFLNMLGAVIAIYSRKNPVQVPVAVAPKV